MRSFRLPDPTQFSAVHAPLKFSEHCLFTEEVLLPYQLPEHNAAFGLLHTITGVSSCYLNGTRNNVSDKSFLVVNQASRLSLNTQNERTQPVMLYFRSEAPGEVAASLGNNHEQLLDNPSLSEEVDFSLLERVQKISPTMRARLMLLASLEDSCSSFHALKADAVVRSLLEELMIAGYIANREAGRLNVIKQSTRIEIYRRLHIAKEWFDSNFSQPVTLAEMADVANMNAQHFLRMFSQVFKKTPHQYLMDIRLDEAKRLIHTTDLSVSEICSLIGWDSLSSFSKLFKTRIGVNPSDFRLTR